MSTLIDTPFHKNPIPNIRCLRQGNLTVARTNNNFKKSGFLAGRCAIIKFPLVNIIVIGELISFVSGTHRVSEYENTYFPLTQSTTCHDDASRSL